MPKMILSQVDPKKFMYTEQWTVSIVAKPKGDVPEHAIIILEGLDKSGENIFFHRYDFVASNRNVALEKCSGMVITKEKKLPTNFFDEEEQITRYFWTEILGDMEQKQGCEGLSWNILQKEAEQLQKDVAADKKNPPDYQISGDLSFFGKSTSNSGHSCYTWARRKLLDLGNNSIKNDGRLRIYLSDFLASRTTTHISPPKPPKDPTSPSPSFCNIM